MAILNHHSGLSATVSASCILLLLATPVIASIDWHIDLEASSVGVGPGSRLEAQPQFFTAEPTMGAPVLLPASFDLTAQRIQVEVDQVQAGITTDPIFYNALSDTTADLYQFPSIVGLDNRNSYRLMVIPEEGFVKVESDCGEAMGSDAKMIQRDPLAASPEERPPIEVDVSQALEWQDCGQSRLTFEGDFTVVLWDWDFVVSDSTGDHPYQTGHIPYEQLGDVPAPVGERREAWLFVEDGSLVLTLAKDAHHLLYVAPDAALHTKTGFLLQDVRGVVEVDSYREELVGDQVYLQGDLDVRLDVSGSGLAADVRGELQSLRVNDGDLYVTAFAGPPAVAARQSVPWLLAAVGVVATVAWVLRPVRVYNETIRSKGYAGNHRAQSPWQKRMAGRTLLAQRALDANRLNAAMRLAKRTRPSNPAHADALAIQARVLLDRAEQAPGDEALLDQAVRALDRALEAATSRDCAVRALCMAADLYWMKGDHDAARQSILLGLTQDTRFVQDYVNRKPYARLLDELRRPAADPLYV